MVISILALLIALLLPALGAAKEMARLTVCSSQVRQVGVASRLYNNDHKDLFPPISIMDRQPVWWQTTACSWVGNFGIASSATDAYQNMGAKERYLNPYLGGPHPVERKISVAHCPSDNRFPKDVLGGPVFGTTSYGVWIGSSYTYSWNMFTWVSEWFSPVGQYGIRGVRVTDVRSPSRMVAMGEWGGAYFGSHPSSLTLWYAPEYWYFHRQTDKYNCVFVDGHVKFLRIPQAQPFVSTSEYTFLLGG